VPAHVEHGRLVDESGAALYTFDRDEPWSSQTRCVDECSRRFPPLQAPAGARRVKYFRVVTRPDGVRQWTFKGKPLYRFSGDLQPGDAGGDGADNLWRYARP